MIRISNAAKTAKDLGKRIYTFDDLEHYLIVHKGQEFMVDKLVVHSSDLFNHPVGPNKNFIPSPYKVVFNNRFYRLKELPHSTLFKYYIEVFSERIYIFIEN